MSRHLLRVLVALLTFTVGLVISPVHFRLVVIAHGLTKDREGYFAAAQYTSSYFIDLVRVGEGYPTLEKANEAFEARVKEADTVLECAPKIKGNIEIGKRVVAIFHDPESDERYVCAFWTHGRGIVEICSTSLMHVLSFERYQEDY